MGLQAQIHILGGTPHDVILVQQVIQAFIEVFQVQQNYSTPCLHADLDLIDVAANLYNMIILHGKA